MAEHSALPIIDTKPTFVPLVALGIVGSILLYLSYRWALPKPIAGIPYNESAVRSLFGDIPQMMAYLSKTSTVWPWVSQQISKHRSPIVQVFGRPFSKPWVIVADYRESQDILLRRTKEFDRSNFLGDVFAGIIPDNHIRMQSTNEQFKAHRNLLKDLMTPGFLNEVGAPQIYSNVETWVALWELKARLAQGRPFSADVDIYNVALDMIFSATFGLEVKDSNITSQLRQLAVVNDLSIPPSPDAAIQFPTYHRPAAFEAIVTLTESIEVSIKAPMPKLAHTLLRQMPYMRKAKADKEGLIHNEIEKAVKRLSSGDQTQRSALDDILQRETAAAKKEGRQPVYHSRTIYDELFGFIIGGHDTTSATLVWTVKNLAIFPHAQNTLRSRLRAAYPAAVAERRNPTIEEITKTPIPYLDATIEEMSRTACLVPGVTRVATVDTTVLGHVIPKGTDVFFLQNSAGYFSPPLPVSDAQRSESSRNSKFQVGSWKPDPEDMKAFQPERWLVKDKDGNEVFDSQAGPLLAFGLGPRGCYGRRMAYLQMRIIMVMMIWNFELKECPKELSSFDAVDQMVRHPKQCYVRLEKTTW